MIGFKELVQNFKDGLPELKDIGKEGLGILGDCAKVAGEFALEGAKAAGDFAFEAADSAFGLSNSTEKTLHRYIWEGEGDLKSDADYEKVFEDAVTAVALSRPKDEYLQTRGKLSRAEVVFASGDRQRRLAVWLLRFRNNEVEKSVLLHMTSPNAKQLQREGQKLVKGYVIDWHRARMEEEQKARNAVREREVFQARLSEQKKVEWVMETFGVKFGDDYRRYASGGDMCEKELWMMKHTFHRTSLKVAFNGIEFNSTWVITKGEGRSVIGVQCVMETDKLENPEAVVRKIMGVIETTVGSKFQYSSNLYFLRFGDWNLFHLVPDDDYGRIVLTYFHGYTKAIKTPAVRSFLGVGFGDSIEKYAVENAVRKDLGNGLVAVESRMNQFLSFKDCYILCPFNKNLAVGVVCNTGFVSDVDALFQKARAIISEKYQQEFLCNNSRQYKMEIFDEESPGRKPYVEIELSQVEGGGLSISAIYLPDAEKAVEEYQNRRLQQERDAESREVDDALNAL